MRIENEVLAVLSVAEIDGSALKLTGQLERKLYEKTNKILELAGGKWNRGKKAHIFDGSAEDAMENIVLTGEVSTPPKLGYFPSPPPVVDRLIELAEIDEGMTILEPSAGNGAIASKIEFEFGNTLVEIDPKRAAALKEIFPAWHVECADFLSWSPGENLPQQYDRIVMNPPFEKQADIRHINHAFRFLKPGGRLVSVMASSVTFRGNKLTTDFREFVESRGGAFEEIPEGAFKESGTMVNTVIVVIPA